MITEVNQSPAPAVTGNRLGSIALLGSVNKPIDNMKDTTKYEKCTITNIRRGTGGRSKFIYAHLVDENGMIIISATLDYIVKAIAHRLA